MRIYELSTTAASAATGDYIAIDSGASGNTKRITYSAFCLNQPAISTTGSITAATVTATSATISYLDTTLARDYANEYCSATGSVTPGSAASAASAIAGTWTSATATSDFSVSANGRLTHLGADSSLYYVNAALSITKNAGSHTATFQLYKTGTALAHIQATREWGDAGAGALSMQGLVSLGQNDYLEIKVYADGGTYTTNLGTSIVAMEVT